MSDDNPTILPAGSVGVGGFIDKDGNLQIEEVSLIAGSPLDQFILYVEREKVRVRRDSGEHALFLLVGKTRCQRIVGEFFASGSARYLPAKADNRQNLESLLGLTIVIDPVHEHRLEVIGPVSWEAFR